MHSLAPTLTELILFELRAQGRRVMLADIEALIEPFLGERMIQEVVSVMLKRRLSEEFSMQPVMEGWERAKRRSIAAGEGSWESDSGIGLSEDDETEGWEDDWSSGVEAWIEPGAPLASDHWLHTQGLNTDASSHD